MVGISEVFMGIFTLSVALIADGSQRVIERVLGYVDGIQKLK
jgi:divalent metal cation (Fe/Co/Zn/Cd) transporter